MAIDSNDIYISLKNNLENKLNDNIQTGSIIDLYNKVISEECRDIYEYIDKNKNPHLFTNTYGEDLDSLGYWVNLPRKENEDDNTYKYRLKDWMLSAESSNTIAIENQLLKPEYSSNIQYVPYTHGSGTASCYVIPLIYDNETIVNALEEAKNLIKDIVSPSLYIEYIVPSIRGVKLNCFLSTTGDSSLIKNNITAKIKEYINGIAPNDYLEVGELLKIGVNEPGVEYFNVLEYYIDNEQITDLKVIQELETKFLFDEIIWSNEV